jgi:ADP-L-glycero-D-manno-heptose 6-epimerase
MMKICVTGNRGFIGRALQVELQKQGFIVIGIDNWIFQREPWQDKLKDYLEKINPDAVFHLGACSNTRNTNVEEMMKLNVESTFIISDWCKGNQVPLIYSSSASVTGSNGSPETLYAWTKFIGEKYVINSGGIALRYFNVYGTCEMHKGLMASVAFQAYQKHKWGEKVYLFPKKPTRDFIYINDVVEANIYAWNKYDELGGKWYDVGTGESRPFEDVLNIMDIPFEYEDEDKIPENYQFLTKANPENFMSGWQAKFNLEDGVNQYKALLRITTFSPY